MKASQQDQERLLNLQSLDTQLLRVARAETTLPEIEALRGLEGHVNDVRGRRDEKERQREEVQRELKRLEDDIALVQGREKRDSDRLQTSTSVKDIQGLEAELRSLAVRRSELEDKLLAVMEELESIDTDAVSIDQELAELETRIRQLEIRRDEKDHALTEEKRQALDERATLVGELPSDLVTLYEKQRERYGIGAALLRGGVSLGSNVRLTESDLANIRRAAPDDVLLCPDSSAILVRTKESGL